MGSLVLSLPSPFSQHKELPPGVKCAGDDAMELDPSLGDPARVLRSEGDNVMASAHDGDALPSLLHYSYS